MFSSMLTAAAFALEQASLAEDYPRFATVMDRWGYDWEAIKVTTEDHYILTTFHVLGKTGEARTTDSAGSVLIQHGDQEDGTSWINNYQTEPFHLKLVDAGYDVWIGSNRGTEYSWAHETLDATQPEYWDWTWAEMGLYDDIANITAIKQAAGVDKIFYLGYSQGTIQMHYGLAHMEQDFHVDNIHKVVQLAPCFVPHVPNWTKFEANRTLMQLQSQGVYSFHGPNWDQDLKTICDFSSVLCKYYSGNHGQGQSVKSEQHWVMNGLKDRFQEFAPNWLDGEEVMPLVDVSQIKSVPMAFFTATNDQVCMHKTAGKYIPQIQSETVQIDVQGEGHLWFTDSANTDWFMENLIAQLQVPTAAAELLQ